MRRAALFLALAACLAGWTGSALAEDLARCRLPEKGLRSDVGLGFPRNKNRLPSVGEVHLTVLFVDFPDMPARMTPEQALALISPDAERFLAVNSYGRLKMVLDPNPHWTRMSKASGDFGFHRGASFETHRAYLQEAIDLTPEADYSKADGVLVIANPAVKTIDYGPAFTANPGYGVHAGGREILNGATSGSDLTGWGWLWFDHEIGHAFSLLDLAGPSPVNGRWNTYVGDFSVMGNIAGAGHEYLGWERWQLGWLDDDQVICAGPASLDATLTPIEEQGGAKMVVVPLGETRAIVVESRHAERYDQQLSRSGLLAYVVDTAIGTHEGPIRILPHSPSDEHYQPALLTDGGSIEDEGVKITSLGGDRLHVERVSSSIAAAAEPAGMPTLPALIDLYLSWRGGAAFGNLQSVHAKAHSGDESGSSDEYWFDRAGHSRDDYDFGGVIKTLVRAPNGAWSINPSGQVEEADPRGPLKARRRALVETGAALRGADGAQVQFLPSMRRIPLGGEKGDEQEWSVIGITFGDADAYALLVDPKTGRLCATIYDESGQTTVFDHGDWRFVDGVRMPFFTVLGGDLDSRWLHFTDIELNKPIAPALFERPVETRKIRPGSPASSGWVNFTFEGGNIRLPVLINGKPVEALLDNGAQSMQIDGGFAASAGLNVTKSAMSVHGVGPSSVVEHWVKDVSVKIGDLTLSYLTVATGDTSQIARAAGVPVPVILGDEAFAELVVDIDFAKHRVRFDRPADFVPPKDAVELPVIRNRGIDSVPLSVEGRPPIQIELDLGYAGELDLFPDYAKAEMLLSGRRTSQSMFSGLGGIQTQTDIFLHRITFGGSEIAEVPTSILPKRVRATFSTEVQGSVGLKVLQRYRLIFDYPHRRLFAMPIQDLIDKPFGHNRLGLSSLPDGEDLLVMLVVPGSPAAAAGLKAGDRIAKVDGKPASLWRDSNARTAMKEGPAGTRIAFTLESGETREVVLADYY